MRRLLAVLLVIGLAGCGDARSADNGRAGGPASAGAGTNLGVATVTVFAAASLTESFTRIGELFEQQNPGVDVTLNFGGSAALATQINQGAPADVFASAAPKNMDAVADAVSPATFAKNQLVIAVAKGNPEGVAGLADLTGPGLKVALCVASVPCGAAAQKALDAAGVRVTPVTLEQDVKAALAKVKLGEVDAALVYRTDVKASAGAVEGVEFPESAQAVNDYPIAVLKDARDPAAARAFVDFVRSAAGTTVLTEAGFQAPGR